MPRLPAPTAIRLPFTASAWRSEVSCAARTPAGSARRFDLTSASTTSWLGKVASGAKRTGIGQLSPQGIRSIIRGDALPERAARNDKVSDCDDQAQLVRCPDHA